MSLQPHQFQAGDHTFTLAVTIKDYLALKRDHNIDLRSFMDEDSALFKALTLQQDLDPMLKLLDVLVASQLVEKQISQDDFYGLLDPTAFDKVGFALLEAIVNFMPAPQRPALRKAMQAMDEGLQRAAVKLEQQADKLAQQELAKMDSLFEQSTSSSGEPQESSS